MGELRQGRHGATGSHERAMLGGSSRRGRPGRACAALAVAALVLGSAAELSAAPPAGLGPGESRYLFATHDFSLDANGAVAQEVLTNGIDNAAHGYPEDSDNGWILWTVPGGIEGGGGGCDLCSNLDGDGFAVIVRLDWSFSGGGTVPVPALYTQFAANAASFAAGSPTVHVWIVGNEPNLSVSWPGGDVITASEYADAYLQVRQAIVGVAGHEDDRVLVAAPGPWNFEAGDWRQYFRDVLAAVHGSYDGSAIHAYTHDSCPATPTSPMNVSLLTNTDMGGGGYWHFKVFENYLEDIPQDMRSFPVYITETDGDTSWSNARDGWLPAAYTAVNAWNLAHPDRAIRALVPYRWEPWDDNPGACRVFSIRNKPERVNDFIDALALGFRWCDAPGLPACGSGPVDPDAGTGGTGGSSASGGSGVGAGGGVGAAGGGVGAGSGVGSGIDDTGSGCGCMVVGGSTDLLARGRILLLVMLAWLSFGRRRQLRAA